jgi:hypothetical protein
MAGSARTSFRLTSRGAWLGAALALALPAAAAAEGGWTLAVSPYVWTPSLSTSVETRFGTLTAEDDIGDILSALDFGLMGVVEARRGRFGLIADFVYSDLTQRSDTPFGALFSRARVESTLTLATGYVAYRAHEDERVSVDVLGGLRASSLDLDVTLTEGEIPTQRLGFSESWFDPIVGGRARVALGDRWFATALADFGGFGGSDDRTWQALGIVGYQAGERWSIEGGWRHLSIEKRIRGRDVELDLDGPLLGVTVAF